MKKSHLEIFFIFSNLVNAFSCFLYVSFLNPISIHGFFLSIFLIQIKTIEKQIPNLLRVSQLDIYFSLSNIFDIKHKNDIWEGFPHLNKYLHFSIIK